MDWDNEQVSLAKKEPRRGKRLTLAATVHCPSGPPLLVYSVHLEVSHIALGKRSQKGPFKVMHGQNNCLRSATLCRLPGSAARRGVLPDCAET